MPDVRPAVLFAAVSKTFAGHRRPTPVFAGLDLAIGRGERLAVLGANGIGKSTLIRLAAGLLLPDAGLVRVRDRTGALVDPVHRAGTCSAVLDGSRGLYWRLTVAENLRYQAALNAVAPGSGLRAAEPWLERFGLGKQRDELVQSLSKGTQQKIAIVAALAFAKPLLMLDEPTTLLDEASCLLLARVLRERSEAGQTIVVATHDREFVAHLGARRLAIEAEGRLRHLDGADMAEGASPVG
jgi:ABC-2 type transport system ATP-binding protein